MKQLTDQIQLDARVSCGRLAKIDSAAVNAGVAPAQRLDAQEGLRVSSPRLGSHARLEEAELGAVHAQRRVVHPLPALTAVVSQVVAVDGRAEHVLVEEDEVGRVRRERRREIAGDLDAAADHARNAFGIHCEEREKKGQGQISHFV